jgi:hypothetical protein
VLFVARSGGAPERVDVVREVDLDHVARTRVWKTTAVAGTPVGAQRPMLSASTRGMPPASTRVDPVSHCAVTHGPVGGDVKGQPATTYGDGCVSAGARDTLTRGLGTSACT